MTETLHFQIDGGALCAIIRDMIVSERLTGALRVLDEIEGLSREQVADILQGNAAIASDFTGMVPLPADVQAEYKQSVDWIYAGRCQLPGHTGWWRPSGALTSVGYEDMPDPRVRVSLSTRAYEHLDWNDTPKPLYERRVMHYAHPGEAVVHVRTPAIPSVAASTCVFFEPCEPPPWWQPPVKDAHEAVLDCHRVGRTIERRGWIERYGGYGRPAERVIEVQPPPPPPPTPQEVDARNREAEARWEAELQQKAEILNAIRTYQEAWAKRAEGNGEDPWSVFEAGEYAGPPEVRGTYRVLRYPFCRWKDAAPPLHGEPYTVQARSGEKIPSDNPWHTDALASLQKQTPEGWKYVYTGPGDWYGPMGWLPQLFYASTVLPDLFGTPEVYAPLPTTTTPLPTAERWLILSRTGAQQREWRGVVKAPNPDEEVEAGSLLYLPALDPEYYIPAASTGKEGIILASVCSTMAHLVQVALEHEGGFPTILYHPDAARWSGREIRIREVSPEYALVELA